MGTELYVVAATAAKRSQGHIERKLFIDFLLAASKEAAEIGSRRFFLESTLKSDEWLHPIFGVDCIPEPRVRHFRDEFAKERDGIRRLTFLWGYAAFFPDRGGLRLGTIIARTKQDAEREIVARLTMQGFEHRSPVAFSIGKVPSRIILPRPPDPEDAADMFRRRLEAYWKKNPRT